MTTDERKYAALNARKTYKEIVKFITLGDIRRALNDSECKLDTNTMTKVCDLIDSGDLIPVSISDHYSDYILKSPTEKTEMKP